MLLFFTVKKLESVYCSQKSIYKKPGISFKPLEENMFFKWLVWVDSCPSVYDSL